MQPKLYKKQPKIGGTQPVEIVRCGHEKEENL